MYNMMKLRFQVSTLEDFDLLYLRSYWHLLTGYLKYEEK